jgi:TRAP-type mannitol/chloroaromatic compound transport system permease small subunit
MEAKMKKIVQIFIDVIDVINVVIASIASVLFIPLMFLSVYEVFTRRLLGSPTIWSLEVTKFTFVPIVVLAMGYTLLLGGHATIDLFAEKFKSGTRAAVTVIMSLIFLVPSSLIMFINSSRNAAMSWASLERTPSAFNMPIYPIKTILPIGFALLFLAALSCIVKSGYYLAAKEHIESKIIRRLKPAANIKEL